MIQPKLDQRKVIELNNYCSFKHEIDKNHKIVPRWIVRVIYNNTEAKEVEIDIVTYQENNAKAYKTLKN